MLSHRQRFERLITVTDFDGRRTLPGMPHAGVVSRATHSNGRVLRQFAVQPVRRVDNGGVGRGAPLARRQKADGACRRVTDDEVEGARGQAGRTLGARNDWIAAVNGGSNTNTCSSEA